MPTNSNGASTDWRTDGALMNAYASLIENSNTGLGIQGRDKFADTAINLAFAPMGRQEVQALYRGSKICEKVVELLPKAATGQNWLELTIGKGRKGVPGKAIQYADGLKFRSAVREASILGRLDGDGFVVLGIDDGRQPNEPVDEAHIRQISWIAPLNRYQLFPNPNSGRPGHPEFYQVFLRQQEALGGKQTTGNIHRSRVLRFPGKQLYGDLILNNSGYNDSVLDAFYRSFVKYLTAIEYSSRMVQDYNTFIYKLKGLANLVLQGKEADILKRFRAIMLSMSSLGGLAIDSENEDGQFISRNFGGLDGLIEKLKDDTSANAGMPPTKVWGSSQKHALSTSSEGDKYEWADCVDDWRGDVLDEPVTDFFKYILLAQDGPTGGKLPEDWNLKYASALRLTLKEQIELRKDQTQGVDVPSIQAGILLSDEVRNSAWAGAEYSVERTLQPDLYAKQKTEKQQPQPGQQQLPDGSGNEQNGQNSGDEPPATSDEDFLKNSQAEFGRSDAADSNLPVTPEQLLDLKEITEEANPDGVDAIRDVNLDDQGRLTWIFRDENQLLRATLNGSELLTDYLGEVSSQPKTDAAGNHLLDILDRTDRHLRSLEDGAIDRVNNALESAYEDLEAKLLKLYSQDEGGSVLAKHRALVLLSQVSDLLSLVNTRNADEIQQQFENLLRGASDQGSTLAQELAQAIANEQLKPFAQVPVAAVRFAAQNAVQRLQKHSDDFREKASTIVTQGMVQGWGPDTIARQLRQQLDTTQSKAMMIARTEALAAHNEAAQDAYQANGIDAFQLIATQDDRLCPFCSARNMQVYKLGESKPPLHPHCRCYSLPWKSSWQQLGLTNDAWAAQFRQKSIAQLQAQGLEPDSGAAPFERANGQSAPTPLWSPSNLDALNLDTWHTRGHGKARNCTKGRSCGGGCVAMHKQCKHDLSPGGAAKGEKVAKEVGAKTGKGKKKEAIGGGGAEVKTPTAQPEVKPEVATATEAPAAKTAKSRTGKTKKAAEPPEAELKSTESAKTTTKRSGKKAESEAATGKEPIASESKESTAKTKTARTKAKTPAVENSAVASPKEDLKLGPEVPTEGPLKGMHPINERRSYKETTDPEYFHNPGKRDAHHAAIVKAAKSIGGEERVREVEQHVSTLMNKADVYTRVSPQALDRIIDDRFKNQFETNTSGAVLNQFHRAKVERDYMGYAPNTPNEMRPTYGYISDRKSVHSPSEADLEQYGSIAIRFKPGVKQRSTFTYDDSFNGIDTSPIANPNAASLVHRTSSPVETRKQLQAIGNAKSLDDVRKATGSLYLEAQIHGQVKPSDIGEIIYKKGSPPSPKVLEWAKANGVKVSERKP